MKKMGYEPLIVKKLFQNLKKWIKFKSGSFVGGIATCSLEFSHDCRRRKIQNDPERKEKKVKNFLNLKEEQYRNLAGDTVKKFAV